MLFARAIPFSWRLGVGLVGLALLLPVGWYLASPLFVNRAVSEALPMVAAQQAPQSSDTALPTVIAGGQFGVVDGIHRGQGSAKILSLPDGTRVLRFEDFTVTNGPDLYVYLSTHPAPRSSNDLHEGGAFEVAQLKGNLGDQNYALPSDLDTGNFASAVIYCRRFSVVFSTAELLPGGSDK
jgi:hypothetical protein